MIYKKCLQIPPLFIFYDVPEHIAAGDALAWYALEGHVYAIDLAKGTFAYQWP